MTQHTPGPWFNDHNMEIRAGEWHSICGMRWPFDDPEHIANAALIAAAPDMLAALQAIAAETTGYDTEDMIATIQGICRAIITKAKGGAA